MSLNRQTIAIESYADVTIHNTLAGYGGSTLVVCLPGLGYTVHAPLFHYLRNIIWEHSDDVLLIQYGFQAAQSEYSPLNQGDITAECQQAIDAALEYGYERLVFVGKSLGTPMAALFANRYPQTSHLILLTPIQDSYHIVQSVPTLAIIGTADTRYDPALTDTEIVTWKIYDGLNHSLEVPDNTTQSLAILPDVMQSCTDFIYG